jgi:hypothetical protein
MGPTGGLTRRGRFVLGRGTTQMSSPPPALSKDEISCLAAAFAPGKAYCTCYRTVLAVPIILAVPGAHSNNIVESFAIQNLTWPQVQAP